MSNNKRFTFDLYFFVPTFFALVLPVFVPLSIRLLSGNGYLGALWLTWGDQHAQAYFGALAEDANGTLSGVLNKTALISHLISSVL